MQKEWCGIRLESDYTERLSPSLWVLVAAAVTAPMAALVLAPIDTTAALLAGLLVGLAVVAGLVAASPRVGVVDGTLVAGRARIDVAHLGEPVATGGEEARTARGTGLDPRAFLVIRGGIDGIVTVPVTDPADPTPAWVLSTRTPERLAAAIRRAQLKPRTPRR